MFKPKLHVDHGVYQCHVIKSIIHFSIKYLVTLCNDNVHIDVDFKCKFWTVSLKEAVSK